jgi:uncharacterized protein YbjT (DUF2867 family)
MPNDDRPVLVIGATGFLGRRVVASLRAKGRVVRCMARTPEKAQDFVADDVSVVQGDMLDAAAVERAVDGVGAVIVCVHTISPQGAGGRDEGFMDVEAQGLRHVVTACTVSGVIRVLYVTSIGVAEHATSSWLRGRWLTEQAMFNSSLDVTVVRPGMIVGRGGDGFSIVARGATKRFAVAIAGPRQKFRTIAVDDLARDLVDLMDFPGAAGQAFEVGSDDVLTMKEMTKIAATSVGRKPGVILFIPATVIRLLAPVVERIGRVPRGAISGLVGDGPQQDMIGNPAPLRMLIGRSDRPFRQAIEGQVL